VPDTFCVGFGQDQLLPMAAVVVDGNGSDRYGGDGDDENDEK
jgi:hypothetical protein